MEAGRIIGITAAVDNRSPLAEAVSQSETEGSIGTEAAPSRPTNDSPRQREREDGSELPLLSDGIGDMTNPIIRVSHLTIAILRPNGRLSMTCRSPSRAVKPWH